MQRGRVTARNFNFGQICYDLGALIGILDKECNIIMHTGTAPVFLRSGLCTTVSYGISGRPKYALESEGFAGAPSEGLLTPEQCNSIALRIRDIVKAMEADLGVKPDPLKISGSLSKNDALLQKIADVAGIPVLRPVCADTAALGAAYMAGVQVGYWAGRVDILPNWKAERAFEPQG